MRCGRCPPTGCVVGLQCWREVGGGRAAWATANVHTQTCTDLDAEPPGCSVARNARGPSATWSARGGGCGAAANPAVNNQRMSNPYCHAEIGRYMFSASPNSPDLQCSRLLQSLQGLHRRLCTLSHNRFRPHDRPTSPPQWQAWRWLGSPSTRPCAIRCIWPAFRRTMASTWQTWTPTC